MNSLSGLGSLVGAEQEDFRPTRSGCRDHSLARAKPHLAGGEVGDHHDQSPYQLFRFVGLLDPCKHVSLFITTKAER